MSAQMYNKFKENFRDLKTSLEFDDNLPNCRFKHFCSKTAMLESQQKTWAVAYKKFRIWNILDSRLSLFLESFWLMSRKTNDKKRFFKSAAILAYPTRMSKIFRLLAKYFSDNVCSGQWYMGRSNIYLKSLHSYTKPFKFSTQVMWIKCSAARPILILTHTHVIRFLSAFWLSIWSRFNIK